MNTNYLVICSSTDLIDCLVKQYLFGDLDYFERMYSKLEVFIFKFYYLKVRFLFSD